MDPSWRQVNNIMKLINNNPELWNQIWTGFQNSMSVPLSKFNVIDYINQAIDPVILLKRHITHLQSSATEADFIKFMDKYSKMIDNNGSLWSFLASC